MGKEGGEIFSHNLESINFATASGYNVDIYNQNKKIDITRDNPGLSDTWQITKGIAREVDSITNIAGYLKPMPM